MTFRPCIVVPVFNHGDEAERLIARLSIIDVTVVVIDDGSTAECRAKLDALAERHPRLHVLHHSANRGKGAAVLTALYHARSLGFSHALQIDADGQHDAGDIPGFLRAAAEHPGAVIAGRPLFDASAPRSRRYARHISNVWVWIETLSFAIPDSLCGFRLYPVATVLALAESVRLGLRMDFDPEVLVRLSWKAVPIVWLPTRVVYPEGGRSNFRLWRDNWLITKMHTRLVIELTWRLPRLLARKLPYRGPALGAGGADTP